MARQAGIAGATGNPPGRQAGRHGIGAGQGGMVAAWQCGRVIQATGGKRPPPTPCCPWWGMAHVREWNNPSKMCKGVQAQENVARAATPEDV